MFFSLTGIGIDNSFDATRERQLESARQTDEEKMNQMIAVCRDNRFVIL